jgi:hypothetical protein
VRAVQGAEALRRALDECRPDLIFTSETVAGGGVPRREVRRIVATCRPRPAVYALEPRSLGDILSDVKTVGDAIGRPSDARALIEMLRARIDAVSLRAAQAAALTGPRRVACLVTVDPPVAAGWWQAHLIGLAGGLDVLDGVGRPPRPTTWAEIERAGPDLVVWLMDEESGVNAYHGAPPLRGIPTGSQESGGEGHPHPNPLPAGEGALSSPLSRKRERGAGGAVGIEGPHGRVRRAGAPVWAVKTSAPGPVAVDLLERFAALLLSP